MKKDAFIKEWEAIRKRGQEKYFINIIIRVFPFLLILLITKDFIVHQLPLNFSKLLDITFKNLFLSLAISALIVVIQWVWNEKKFKKISEKEKID